jgi:hypothetical protein
VEVLMKRLLGNGLLVISIGMLASCSNTLSPAYTPAGLLHLKPASTPKLIRLRTIDETQNTAPLGQQVSALRSAGVIVLMTALTGPVGGLMAASTPLKEGAPIVCPTCGYQLKETPVKLVRDMAAAALAKGGITIAEEAPRELDLRILKFDFITISSVRSIRVGATILMRAEMRENGQTLADAAVLETAAHDWGQYMSKGGLEGFVGRTASRAVERILGEPQVSTALLEGL